MRTDFLALTWAATLLYTASIIHSAVPPCSQILASMKNGTQVVRGKDWRYPDLQDGGVGSVGTIMAVLSNGTVSVKWFTGNTYQYKMTPEQCDLDIAPKLVDLIKIGTWVTRGKDWQWGEQDGGIGQKGTVIGKTTDGYVKVKWNNFEEYRYRMGADGKFDLDIANTTTHVKPTGVNYADLIKVGTKVVKGKDWPEDIKDGGPKAVGKVTKVETDGWVEVKWNNGGTSRARMGWHNAYDLYIGNSANWLLVSRTTQILLFSFIFYKFLFC